MLNAGETISIKAYGYMIEKVVSMTEILKNNLGELNQETVFLSQPREQRFEDKEEDEAKRKGRFLSGILVFLSLKGTILNKGSKSQTVEHVMSK